MWQGKDTLTYRVQRAEQQERQAEQQGRQAEQQVLRAEQQVRQAEQQVQVVRAEELAGLALEVAYFVHNIVVAGKKVAGKEMVAGHRDLNRMDCRVVGSQPVHMPTVHRAVAVHRVVALHRVAAVHMVGGRKEFELHKAGKVGMAA